jgi:copper chaperone CopZ
MTNEIFQTIRVEGMSCSHCEANVTRNLSKLEGIDEVIANKDKAQVIIRGSKIDLSEVERIVTDLGYQYKGEVQ